MPEKRGGSGYRSAVMDTSELVLEERVRLEIRDQVAWVTIDNPDRGNSLAPDMRDELASLIAGLNGQFEARAAVITGTGTRSFCTGADLSVPRPPPVRPDSAPHSAVGEVRRTMLDGQIRMMSAVLDCQLPVIAAVNGTAAGVGVHLALCCDLVILASHARLIEIFARRGLVPDGLGAWILPRLVGLQKAKELAFLADDVPAGEALQLGLCSRVVDGEVLEAAAAELAERLATGPPRSFMLPKALLNRSLDVDRNTLAELEAWAVEVNNSTLDAAEGVTSFLERRDPVWRGY